MPETSSDDHNESSYHPDDENYEQMAEEGPTDDNDDSEKNKLSSMEKEYVRPPTIVIHKGKEICVTKISQDAADGVCVPFLDRKNVHWHLYHVGVRKNGRSL